MLKGSILKRFYIVVILAGPLYWLILTDEGRRFTDTTILKIQGGETMDIHLEALHSTITEKGLQEQLPDTPFNCGKQPGPLGDRICQVQLAAFNGLPSRFAVAYFHEDHLRGFKVGYQRPYHEQLLHYLHTTLGKRDVETVAGGAGIYRWQVGDGELVVLDEQSLEGNEPSLMWKRQASTLVP
ncbi:MAG: hypothetical protein OEZ16_10945 [Chromatiales bacterium]|nr:hypothetical protein [Chromatiales bacterium]